MMNKEFVPYQEALALKELGFNEDCFGYYNNHEPKRGPRGLVISGYQDHNEETEGDDLICSAPTYSQAFRFFREKYEYMPHIFRNSTSGRYSWKIDDRHFYVDYTVYIFNSYEEAELACLQKLIEIVKTK